MEENTKQNNQNSIGQNSQQGASFGNGNSANTNTSASTNDDKGTVGSNVVGNDTAAVGSGGVVSLKGGQTKREIDEQRKIEELKSKAVKLERKLTPREKELERMHKEAIKPRTFVSHQSRKVKTPTPWNTPGGYDRVVKNEQTDPNQAGAGQKQNLTGPMADPKKQEELVENLINPIEIPKVVNQAVTEKEVATPVAPKPVVPRPVTPKPSAKKELIKEEKKNEKNIPSKISTEKKIKKVAEQKPVKRMVISPAGQISYVDNKKIEDDITTGEDKKTIIDKGTTKNNSPKASASSNIINLKSEEKNSAGKQMDASSTVVKSKKALEMSKTPKVEETPWEEKKVDLKTLSSEKRIDMQATPSMASVNFNMDDDFNKEVAKWFDEYNELPVNIKLGLGSSEVRQKIKDLAVKNNLMEEGPLGEISRIIRDVYVKLIKAEDIRKRLSTVLKLKDTTSDVMIKEIGNIVGLVKEVGNKKSNEYFDKLSLKDALEKYPNIATEEITAGRITDKQSDKYVDATVQNWVSDYINQMGSGKHTNLERGKYLNDSNNTRNLDKNDKKIIEKLTKSYDEDSKLIIDREEEVILWNLHDDESKLGINSDKSKRVINKFKIEEAQSADIDKDKAAVSLSSKKSSSKVDTDKSEINLENSLDNSIIKDRQGIKKNDKERGILNLSSEIENLGI